MTNDAKFGMLAGVLGVIVAGVLSSRAPDAPKEPPKPVIAPRAALPEAPAPRTASATSPEPELQGTPVVRTRKEPTAQPASRPTAWDEEP
jgi:hypothetical protein